MLTICLPAADSRPTSRCGEMSPWPSRVSSARVLAVAARRWENAAGRQLVAEVDVLRDGQAVDDVELLVHRRDAELEARDRVRDGDRLAVEEDLALGRLVGAGEHLDERRLAGAVLAQQAVDLAGPDLQVDAVERPGSRELLHDAAHLQQRRVFRSVCTDHGQERRTTSVAGQAKVATLVAQLHERDLQKAEWFTVRMDELLKFAPRPTGAGDMFQLLRDGQPRTRSDLATLTGQARSTIAARVDLLLVLRARRARRRGQLDRRPPARHLRVQPRRPRRPRRRPRRHARAPRPHGPRRHGPGRAPTSPSRSRTGPAPCSTASSSSASSCSARPAARSATSSASASGLPGPVEHSTGRPINPPIMPGWDDADVPGLLSRKLARPRARGQRRQRHGPRRAHVAVARGRPPPVRQGRHRHRRRDHLRRRRSAAAPRARPATSGTSPSRAGSTCRAAAATSAASRPSPAAPPSRTPSAGRRDQRRRRRARAGRRPRRRAARCAQAGRRHRRRCSPRA